MDWNMGCRMARDKDTWVIRGIALFKFFKALVLLAVLATSLQLIRHDPTLVITRWALSFHVDPDNYCFHTALASLLQLVAPTQIVFGTDFPPGGTSAGVARSLADVGLFSENDLRAIDRQNAVRLLPRFA